MHYTASHSLDTIVATKIVFIYLFIGLLSRACLSHCSGKATGHTTETSDFNPRPHYSLLFYIQIGFGNHTTFYSMGNCVGDVEE